MTKAAHSQGGRVSAIVPAAGRGTRMKITAGAGKQYLYLRDKPVLAHTLIALESSPCVDEIVVVVAEDQVDRCREDIVRAFGLKKVVTVIAGGNTRQESVWAGLQEVSADTEIVLVHDGARPLVTVDIIARAVEAARQCGAAGVAVPVKDTIKVRDEQGYVVATPPRQQLWAMQTPQVFTYKLLWEAHAEARRHGWQGTDDCMLVERLGHKVKLVEGSYRNIKITTPSDMIMAAALLEASPENTLSGHPPPCTVQGGLAAAALAMTRNQDGEGPLPRSEPQPRMAQVNARKCKATLKGFSSFVVPEAPAWGASPDNFPRQETGLSCCAPRVGWGYDVHRLVEGRPLILGGVKIPFERGLLGHSDADVLVHAIIDALLGAAGLGDIGQHFPPDDPRWAGADSLVLLRQVGEKLQRDCPTYRIGHIDAVIVAERPRLASRIPSMRANIAGVLGLRPDQVSIKATTTEGLGFTGEGKGMAAQAVATLI